MADVPVAPPPPPPPPGDLLGNSIPQSPTISSGNAAITPSQSGSSLYSASGGSEASSVSNVQGDLGKRPATIDEIRQSARKWSLAGDAGVLLYLQQFSQNMILKTHELEKVVENLAYETKGLDSKVHNTFNDFLMLSNKQFIENRVYDEEVSQEETSGKDTPQQQNKSREQLEAEILPRFSQAVNLGFQVLEDAFITVELKPSEESDDEDEESLPAGFVPDPIIEPKDMYISRPLPHLIGSAEFFSDDTLGLIEIDEEEEGQKKKEEGSDESDTSESEEESESQYSESSEEDTSISKKKKQISDGSGSEEESESEEEDLFGETTKKPALSSEGTDESEDEEASQPKPKMGIQEELAAKLGLQGQVPKANIAEDKNDKSDTQSIVSKKSLSDTKSVSSIVDPEKVAAGSTVVEREGKHRSGSKRSEGGHRKHKGSTKHHHHHHHHKKADEDLESDEDLFGESKPEVKKIEDASPFGKKGGMFSGGGTLFGSEPESDLFGEIEKEDVPSSVAEKPTEPQTPTEIKPRARTTSSGKKLPAGAVSLFGGANLFSTEEDSKENTIEEENVEENVPENVPDKKKPPPIVKGLFDDDDDADDDGKENSIFDSKPNKNTLQEPPKQKRKKTLELFDDKDESSDLFNSVDKKSPAKLGAEPKKVKGKTPGEKTEGLFADTNNEKLEATPKVAEKIAASKPKVLSLFDDDDAEEEDWFDNMKPSQTATNPPKDDKKPVVQKDNGPLFGDDQPTEDKVQPLKRAEKERMPSKTKKVSLFDEDDEDDLFGTSSAKPSNKGTKKSDLKGKPTVEERTVKEAATKNESNRISKEADKKEADKVVVESKASNLSVGKKSKAQKGRSFIDEDGSGLFGDDQDDLFTAPIKKPPAQAKDSAAKKKPKQSVISFLDDDDDDDFFGVSSQSAKKKATKDNDKSQTAKSEEKWTVEISKSSDTTHQNVENSTKSNGEKSSDILADDEENALFDEKTATGEKTVSEGQSSKEVAKIAEADDSHVPQQKPKKLAGAVPMFGGLDPFAAKKALRSASKEESQSQAQDISKDDDLLSVTTSKRDSHTAGSETTAQTPAPSRSSKTPKQVEEKERSPRKDESEGSQEESRKAPNIVFDPAALLPGATPPQRIVEPPPASFDDPPPLQTLTNPNKDRARIQQKRRPPTRQLRQGQIPTEKSTVPSVDVPATHIDNTSSANAATLAEKTKTDLDESLPSEEKTTGNRKTLKVEDIFLDDDDDLFVQTKTPPIKQGKEIKNKISEKTESTQIPASNVTSNKIETEKIEPIRSDIKISDNSDIFSGDISDADNIFGVAKASSDVERKSNTDSSSEIETKNSAAGKVTFPKEAVKETSQSQAPVAKEANDGKESEDEDLFKPSEKKEKKIVNRSKDEEDGKGKKEDMGKGKKKKDKTSIFSEGVGDDLFGGATKKKEDKQDVTKKPKKSSKTVTDEDLFGDSGTIFDIPSKTRDKKKKKSDSGKDIFNAKDDDIFAAGSGEKKSKTKKKVDKKAAGKTSKTPANDTSKTPDIFNDPLNALSGD